MFHHYTVIQNRCVQATQGFSRLVIETARQRPPTLKDLRTQELAIEMQTRLQELNKFQPFKFGSLHQIAFQVYYMSEKFCSITGAPLGRLVDENLREERAMLAQL